MSEVSLEQFAAAHADGATVIDVREPGEYVGGHVPGAVLMPMGQLPSRTSELDRSRPVYVICASGNRAGAMTDSSSTPASMRCQSLAAQPPGPARDARS